MQARFSAVNQAFHWLTVLLMMAILPIAWIMISLPKDAPTRDAWFTTHKTIGLLILALTVLRILWRFIDVPPRMSGLVGAFHRVSGHIVHGLLLVVLLVMPISGYLLSTFAGKPPVLFGLWPLPALVAKDMDSAKIAGAVHVFTQWAVYALVILHVGGVAYHIVFGRTGVLGRILPAGALEPR